MNREEHLQALHDDLDAIGFGVDLTEGTAADPAMVEVFARDDDETMANLLFVGPYPAEAELDDANYVQFYSEYDLALGQSAPAAQALATVNRQLVLGHFGLNEDGSTLYWRYVLVSPADAPVPRQVLVDVMDMALYAIETFGGDLASSG